MDWSERENHWKWQVEKRDTKWAINKVKYSMTNKIWLHLHLPIKIIISVWELQKNYCWVFKRGMKAARREPVAAATRVGRREPLAYSTNEKEDNVNVITLGKEGRIRSRITMVVGAALLWFCVRSTRKKRKMSRCKALVPS